MKFMPFGSLWPLVRLFVTLFAAVYLAACAASVLVGANFPDPLVEPLPVRIGLILDEELTGYEHYEEIPHEATWTIQLGEANAAMLGQLFQSMFLAAESVDDVPLGPEDRRQFDGVLRPELEKFEFDVPRGRNDVFVEVWMQYRLRLYEPDGELVAEWPVSGYGKAEIGNRERALNQAAVVAMREVGATISTTFSEQPQVEYWLQEKRNEAALPAETQLID